jgi:hypothetical protein
MVLTVYYNSREKISNYILRIYTFLPKDYHIFEAPIAGGAVWELCWRKRKLLAGSLKSDRSKGRNQTKCSPPGSRLDVVLTNLRRKKFLVTKPHIRERYARWPKFFKTCRATEEDNFVLGAYYELH